MHAYIRFADSLSAWVAKAFAWCVMVMTLGVSYEVFVRYVTPRSDGLGLRRFLHHVRHAIHARRRLYAVARRACAGGYLLQAHVAAQAGGVGVGALFPLLLSGHPGADLRGMEICVPLVALPRSQHDEPRQHPDLPVQDRHHRRRRPPARAGHRAGHALHHLPQDRARGRRRRAMSRSWRRCWCRRRASRR